MGFAMGDLMNGGSLSGKDLAHILVSTLIWVVLPLVIGINRVRRAELK